MHKTSQMLGCVYNVRHEKNIEMIRFCPISCEGMTSPSTLNTPHHPHLII